MNTLTTAVARPRARVDSLGPDGVGYARVEGRTIAIEGALPDEVVEYRVLRRRRRPEVHLIERFLSTSDRRREPRCRYFGTCGGCTLQHLDPDEQVRYKQGRLLEVLRETADVVPDELLPAVRGPLWGYRRKTRLGVRFVIAKDRVLVGFRERFAPFVTDMQSCEILDPRIAALIEPLAVLIGRLSIRQRLPQIEAAAGDHAVVLVLRVLDPPTPEDLEHLRVFAAARQVRIHLQRKGPDTIQPLSPGPSVDLLDYRHREHRVTVGFAPHHFTQINNAVNQRMVSLALGLMAVSPGDRVLDLFCGVGNFTLPIARHAGEVVGVEGDAGLVAMARRNAAVNGLENARFWRSDLQRDCSSEPWARFGYSAAVLDPPRSGAATMVDLLPALGISRLVYLSCHADTLARDAALLVQRHDYRLTHAGVLDMFPHTAHFETIAHFEKRVGTLKAPR